MFRIQAQQKAAAQPPRSPFLPDKCLGTRSRVHTGGWQECPLLCSEPRSDPEGTGSSCLLCSSLLRHHAGVGTFEEMLRKGRKPPTLPQLRTLLPEKHPGARGRKFLAPFTHQGSKSCVSQTEKFSIMDRSKRFLIPAPQRPRKFKASLLESAGHRASGARKPLCPVQPCQPALEDPEPSTSTSVSQVLFHLPCYLLPPAPVP